LHDTETELSAQQEVILDMDGQIALLHSTIQTQETHLTELHEAYANLPKGILWSYGTGVPGVDKNELHTPHMIEDLGGGRLLVVEQSNCSVIIIDKQTGEILWQFGERGVSGTGERLSSPHSARLIKAGPHEGHIIITELEGSHRVLIVDPATGEIVWETSSIAGPLDAIYWDDEHVMVSDWTANELAKIRISDEVKVWSFQTAKPFYLQKLVKQDPDWWNYGNSYGGDLLFGTTSGYIAEIDTATASVVWELGKDSMPPAPMLADQFCSPVRAFRYGCGENTGTMAATTTILADEGNARLLAVNKDKRILWEIGGVSLNFYNPISWLIEPTYVDVSDDGTLLVCDGMANKIYEIAYPVVPAIMGRQQFSSQILAKASLEPAISTSLAECGLLDFFNNRESALTVACTYDVAATAGIKVHVFSSYDGTNWDTAELLDSAEAPIFGEMPFEAGEPVMRTVDVTSNVPYWKVVVDNQDTTVAVFDVKVIVSVVRY